MKRKPTRVVSGARMAVGFRNCGFVARDIVSAAWLFVRLKASNITLRRTREPNWKRFSARTSITVTLSSRNSSVAPAYIVVPARLHDAGAAQAPVVGDDGSVSVRAKFAPDWKRSTGERRM